jgi:hypothetical protein
MVCLDLFGLQLSARSGKEAKKTSGDTFYFGVVTVVPMRTTTKSAMNLRTESQMN